MLLQLPEDKKNTVIPLFKNRQPNNSALWCYFNDIMPGSTYVDDLENPKKAICVLKMSWTFISDDADFLWIESALIEIIKKSWIQVIWSSERGSVTPLKDFGKVIPRYEYTQRKTVAEEPTNVEIKAFNGELYDKLPWKNFHESVYGSKEAFLNKAFGFYALENGEICSEAEGAFVANGYTEIGIITTEEKRKKGFAFAACVRLLEEIDKRGLKPIWACDKDNPASQKLAEKLGFVNPVEYKFIFFPQKND